MLTLLALIPSVVLLVYIYKKDKKEKEPMKLLIGCFILGAIAALPMVIVENIEDEIVVGITTEGSLVYAILDGFIVAGLTEEFFKYIFLKAKTWRSKYFDCMFDGIVYSVFVSLGFATLENLFYVWEGGIGTAILRMLSSVPGHCCFAVYMGYFYSKAKIAEVKGDKALCKKNKKKALWIPVIIHGIYDCLLMVEEEAAGEYITILFYLVWMAGVIALFIVTFMFVSKAAKDDDYIVQIAPMNIGGESESTAAAAIATVTAENQTKSYTSHMVVNRKSLDTWKCSCGVGNIGNYCTGCGSRRPEIMTWTCNNCKKPACGNFCSNCGEARQKIS